MEEKISDLQRLKNELEQLRNPRKNNLIQKDTTLPQRSEAETEKNKGGFVGGVGYTAEKLGLGVLRSLEGISDFVVGGIADLFGGDEFAENLMKNDWVNYSHADEWYDPGKGWQFVGDVAGGVGNMLPSIIITAATAGAAAPVALAGSIASTGQFIGSAMGQSVSEATKETGSLGGKEWLYGTASGALEGGIEAISGGIGGTQVGKVLGKQLGKSTLGKIGMTVAGEGLEEVASDIANPLLKRATGVDENAKVDWKELPRTFAVGGVTGAVMGGGKRVLDAAKVGGFNNLNAAETTQELTDRQADNNIRQLKGKTATYTQEDIARTKENLSKRLQKMDVATRAQFLQANANIANQFNEDGTVKSVAPAPDTYNTNAYSASLQGREGTFAYKPILESSKTTVQAKQVMDTLTKITDGKTNIVLTEDALTTESGGNANGLYKDGIIYLNANATDYQKALTVGVHEVIHGLEGTKEYEQLAKAITEEIKNDPDLAQQYNIDKYRNAYDKILEGEWTEGTKDYQAATEIFADFLGNKVANNEQLLRNLAVRNSNVVVRFLNWVRNAIASLGESSEERAVRKDLKKLEGLLVNALEAGTGGISLERVEELSKSAEKRLKMQDGNVQSVKFSENKNADGKIATARASIEKAVGGRDVVIIEMDILEGVPKSKWIDVVKDAISRFKPAIPISGKLIKVNADTVNEYLNSDYTTGIKKYDKVTYVDKMRASNQLDEIILATTNYVNEDLKHKRKDNIKEFARGEVLMKVGNNKYKAEVVVGFTSGKNMVLYDIVNFTKTDFSLTKKKVESPERQVSLIQEKQPSTSIIRENSEKSTQNAKKVEKTSTSRSSLNVDSEGNSLTAEQAEYFKDSKVRDKDGNLLVMYHGTGNDFTVFNNKQKRTRGRLNFGEGFYFASNKGSAENYIEGENRRIIEAYVDIQKPYITYIPSFDYDDIQKIQKEFPEAERGFITYATITKYLKKLGYDGVIQYNVHQALKGNKVIEVAMAFNPNQIKNTTNKKPTSNPDIRYSIDLTFAEQVDATLNGADASQTHLKLLDETPALLQEAGFPNLPVLMTAKHLKTITSSEGKDKANYHGLSVDIVKNLPEYISNPVMIADSLTRGDSVVIITEAMDSKNRPVVAAILLDGVGRFQGEHINANIMTSAYGKDNFQVFLNKIADGNAVIYWDKKKSQDLSVSLGIQFPDAITSLNSNIIIRKANAFVNNFSEKSQKTSKGRYSIDVNSPKEQREAVWTSLLSRYVHRLNLPKDVKAHVVELYGKEVANRIFNVWENTSFEDGVDIVTAHKELERDGFSTYSQYTAEFLRDMDSTLHNIAPKVYKAAENGKDIAKNDTLRAGKKESVRSSDEIELSGRQAQQVAKYTKKKVYKKQDAEVIVNDILDGYMTYEEAVGSLSGKNRKQVVQMLWEGLNKSEPGQQMRIALKVADYLIEHTVMENIHSEMAVEIHSDTIKILKPYLHNLNLDNLKEDIKYHFGNNSPYLRWGKRKGEKGIGIDVAAMELNEKGFYIEEINNVDILLRIDEAYRNAVEGIKQTSTRFVNEILGKEKQKTLRQDLARELLRAFKQHGADSELTKTLHEYDKKVQNWKEKYYEERERNSRTLYVLHKVQQLKDVERGTFANASEFKNDIFKKSIGLLGRIKYRGNLNKSGTRKILGSLLEWYVPENPILEGEVYNEEIAKMLLQLSDNMKPLTADQYDLLAELEEKSGCKSFDKLKEWYTRENLGNRYSKVVKSWLNGLADPTEFTVAELRSLENVVDYFKNFIEKYNKVYRNGKLVEAAPLVEKYIKQLQKRKRTKISWLRKPFEKYMSTFADPMAVARYYDGYEDGFFSEMLEAFRMAAIAAVEMEQTLQAPLENFYQKNKKFLKNSYDRMIEYQGEKIPVQQAMLLYMTLKREQAVRGLAYSGFKFRRENETVSVKGFASAENLDIDSLRVQALQEQETIFQQLNDAEREYISIVEKIFNEDCKKAKSETDILRQGYTNISDGYYVPIRRASIAQNVEKWTYKDEMATISEFSFNKDTVAGAKNQLFIDSLTDVLTKHVGGISQYSKLALAVDSYNILFNMNISGNPNVAINVKSESENVWAEGGRYFSELIDDIKGVAKSKGSGQKFVRTLRSGYAKYQLGANPKVWITQLSSFAAATNILDTASIIKGVTVSGKEVDKYCPLAKIRNSENSAALAQGVIEKTGKIGDVLMKPIGAVDRWVVQRLFGACQIQVARGNGPKLGTEENLTKAGELLMKVILETQQNALATERSAAMRSGSEIMKSFTMFSADSMKVLGRVVDGIGEVAVLRARIRVETDAKVKAELKQRLARANKQAAKSISALVVSALFMASVALGFKWLYNKDDKDEDVGKNLATDTIGNLLGGLPFIRDVYSFFSDGYEVQNFAYVAFNDLLDSATIVKDLSNSLIEGKEIDRRELTLSIRKLTYASGQILGIPTRNMYNVAYGLTKRISPETAYKWNDAFYKSSYKSDLQKAIDNEDEEMMATIVGLMLNENVGGIEDEATRKVMDSLIASGYDILPKAVPDKIAYKEDEETVEVSLTKKQKDSFAKSYFTANEAAARMVKSTQFNKLGQEEQATALKLLYNAYYNLAVDDCLERDSTQKNVLFMAAFDPAILAAALARIKAITADTDKKGKAINGSRKSKIVKYIESLPLSAAQKYMIMGYLGYKNIKGEEKVKKYINGLKLSTAEKELLFKHCGYEN